MTSRDQAKTTQNYRNAARPAETNLKQYRTERDQNKTNTKRNEVNPKPSLTIHNADQPRPAPNGTKIYRMQ